MKFQFSTSHKIIFGSGSIAEAARIVQSKGKKLFLITGKRLPSPEILFKYLITEGVSWQQFKIGSEPDILDIEKGTELLKQNQCDVVLGFGGGSVIDAGKAISALATNQGNLFDFLEVVGGGNPLTEPSLPYIAIPTTAGTGSEVTKNAVINVPEKRVKVSLRSESMYPNTAIIDPELLLGVVPELTAYTGMDALTQVIEPFLSTRANPFADNFALSGIQAVVSGLKASFDDGSNIAAREQMAYASLMGGLSLANAGLGAVHGFAGPIGGMYANTPHGAICACLLPYVLLKNFQKLSELDPNDEKLKRFLKLSALFTGNPKSSIDEGIEWIFNLRSYLNIPTLAHFGIAQEDFSTIAQKAHKSSSMKTNPVPLSEDDLIEILDQASKGYSYR